MFWTSGRISNGEKKRNLFLNGRRGMPSETLGMCWSFPSSQQEGAPNHYNPGRETTQVWDDHILPPRSWVWREPRKTQSLAWRIGPERSEFQAWGDPSPVVWAWGCGEEGRWQLSPPEVPFPRVWVAPAQVTLSNSHASPQLWPPLGLWPLMLPTCWWQGQQWQWAVDLCQLLKPQLPSSLAVAAGLFFFFLSFFLNFYLFVYLRLC